MAGLKFGKYELELAVDAESEFSAIAILSDVFGEQIENKITIASLSKYGELFIIRYHFNQDELTDKVYEKLSSSDKIHVINDSLSLERAGELLKICLPVEILLKRLLIYVYPEILETLNGKLSKEKRIEICQCINKLMLGELLLQLEVDIAVKKREKIFLNDGRILLEIIKESKDYEELKSKIREFLEPVTVWDQINSILENPIEYGTIRKQLGKLHRLRNKAAHPQIILAKDIEDAKKFSKHVINRIGLIRNDYGKKLSESMAKFSANMDKIIRSLSSDLIDNAVQSMADFPQSFGKMLAAASSVNGQTELLNFIQDLDCPKIKTDLLLTYPEMDQIMKRFEDNQASDVIDDINDELSGLEAGDDEDDEDSEDENSI